MQLATPSVRGGLPVQCSRAADDTSGQWATVIGNLLFSTAGQWQQFVLYR
jgi:hypothetical protein